MLSQAGINSAEGINGLNNNIIPIFDYGCNSCGAIKADEFVLKHDEKVPCDCGETMTKRVSAPALGNMGANGISIPTEQNVSSSWADENKD